MYSLSSIGIIHQYLARKIWRVGPTG
jgi:hypothetical protein